MGLGLIAVSTAFGVVALQMPGLAAAGTPAATSFNLFIPGTWETSESADPSTATGMLAPIANAITYDHGQAATNYFLPYTARAFDNGQSYVESKNTAIANAAKVLQDYASAHPAAKFTITGYSQGADAAGDLAASIGNGEGPISADKVIGVALLSDPSAGTDGETAVGPATSGTGITGARTQGMGSLAGRVMSICNPSDRYCSTDQEKNILLAQIGAALGTSDTQTTTAVRQTATAVERIAAMDFTGIGDNIDQLQAAIAAGDVHTAHRISGTLNNQLQPLVTAAAAVDYGTTAKVLALIPDETGLTRATAALCEVLDRIDIERTANLVGKTQELTWSLIQAGHGTPASPSSVGSALTQLVEIGQEMHALTTGFVNGSFKGTNGVPLVSGELESAARALVNVIHASVTADPAAAVNEVLEAKDFVDSGTHVNYSTYVVDQQGTTALNWFAGWLSSGIASAY
ncbi:cutinase family protein [Gordonia sp. CPCC 206044]|uniref:cutinase family protein n=1 Tax=Gordonia sp. CPCC 206044 TaxID=3140793 RepID=UPI003AF3C5FA